MFNIKSFSLVEMAVTNTIALIICATSITYLLTFAKVYNKIQQRMSHQSAKLIIRHYIKQDLQSANKVIIGNIDAISMGNDLTVSISKLLQKGSLQKDSDILVIYSETNIIYYVRKSILPTVNNKPKYAIYRDNIIHNAQAIIEDIVYLKVHIVDKDSILVIIKFTNLEVMKILCTRVKEIVAVY